MKLNTVKLYWHNMLKLSSSLTHTIGPDPTHCVRKNLDPTRPDPRIDPTYVQLCATVVYVLYFEYICLSNAMPSVSVGRNTIPPCIRVSVLSSVRPSVDKIVTIF